MKKYFSKVSSPPHKQIENCVTHQNQQIRVLSRYNESFAGNFREQLRFKILESYQL